MSLIWTPPEAQIGQQIDAELERRERLKTRHGHLRSIERALQSLDARLSLVKAGPNPSQHVLVGGAWHIRRENDQTFPTFIPIVDDDGRPREPTMADVYRLQRSDMHRPGYFDDVKREWERERQAKEADKLRASLDRREHIKDLWHTLERPSVGYSGSKWTNSTKGKRGR